MGTRMYRRRSAVLSTAVIVALALTVATAAEVQADDAAFSFAVLADSRGRDVGNPVNVPVLTRIFQDMNSFAPSFCLFPGDLVLGGPVDNHEFMRQLRTSIDASAVFHGPIYPAPGNHEMRRWPNRDVAWHQAFPGLPHNGPGAGPAAGNYYFDYAGSRFISVLSDHEGYA